MDPFEILNKIGKGTKSVIGDRLIMGYLFGLIEDETPGKWVKCIYDDTTPFEVTDEEWKSYAEQAGGIKLDDITLELVEKELKKHRADLMDVIEHTYGGHAWLEKQINFAKSKLSGAS